MLAARGAKVAVNDLVPERAESTAQQITAAGGVAAAVAFDVSSLDAVAAGVDAARQALGPVDILVNNAGVPAGMGVQPFRNMSPADWQQYIDLNLYGVVHGSKAVLDGMVERGFGRIVTISSAAGQMGIPLGVSLYGAGKAGAIGFSRHLAMEVASTGVTVNCVALGVMDHVGNADVLAQVAKTVPVGRLGTAQDAGAAVVYLASNEASWVTGQTLGVNGGSHTP
jgi:3-oxoacyl-[acyl-carrier protein] reductase